MGWFDTPIDFSDPQVMARIQMLGNMAGSFGDSAMPTALPTPMGAVLGRAARSMTDGMQSGAKGAQGYRGTNLENTGKAIGNDQALIVENMLRRALGKPELTVQDLQNLGADAGTRSPLFGMPTLSPQGGTQGGAPAYAPAQGGRDAATGAKPTSDAQQSNPAPGQGGGIADTLVMKILGFQPTDYQRAKMAADLMAPGPAKIEAERAAAKIAGIDVTLSQRAGEASSIWNPETGKYEEVSRNPNLSPDLDYNPNTKTASIVPGALEGLGALETVRRGAAAQFEPLNTYDAAGNETIVPRTALRTGIPQAPGQAAPAAAGVPFATRVAQIESSGNLNPPANGASSAAGSDQFLKGTWLPLAKKYLPTQITHGRSDDQILALRSDPKVSAFLTNQYAGDNAKALQAGGIKNVGASEIYLAHHFGPQGAQAILKAPVNTPLSQILPAEVLKANPDLANATVADVYAHARQQMHGVQAPSLQAPAPAKPQPPKAPVPGTPNTPVQNSASGIPTKLDDFLGTLGPGYQPPSRPAVPAGALMGEPSKGTEEIQKLDGDRLEQYSKEAAGGQKIYTNLQQLYQIMARGISTGHMTGEATALTNMAQQLGLGRLVPKTFDPNDAAAFNKLATDLVFAQLKQIGGRPMVSEIEGLKQANPNTSLPPAANIEILNNILADQRWRDARADLGRQYMARFGSLGDFDARFNEKYPEVDAFNQISDAAAKSGWTLPGAAGLPSGPSKSDGIKPDVQKMITPEAIAATAKKYGETEDQVKANLKARGYQVP